MWRRELAYLDGMYYYAAICITFVKILTGRYMIMQTSTVTTKGQITIPAALRRHMGLRQGDEVAFIVEHGKVILVPVLKDIEAAFGLVQADHSVSLDDMEHTTRVRAGQ